MIPIKIKHIYQSNSSLNQNNYGAAIDENNFVWWWGVGYPSQITSLNKGEPALDMDLEPIKQLALGSNHALGLKEDGTVLAWGNNSYGQFGDGTKITHLAPGIVPGLTYI